MPAKRCKLVTKKIYIYSLMIKENLYIYSEFMQLAFVFVKNMDLSNGRFVQKDRDCQRQRLTKTEIDRDRD